jgi:hypothetical protein
MARRAVAVHPTTHHDDPFRLGHRPPESTLCPTCKASFQGGRWTWLKAPADSYEQICPACQRIHDHFPAGYLGIKGDFFAKNRDEMVAFIQNFEKTEKADRPLQRIMAIEERKDGVEITTTDSQLARGLAEAVHETFKGDLKLRYSRDENLVRANWKR